MSVICCKLCEKEICEKPGDWTAIDLNKIYPMPLELYRDMLTSKTCYMRENDLFIICTECRDERPYLHDYVDWSY